MPQRPGQNATDGFLPGTLEPWAERLDAMRPWSDRKSVRELLEEWAPNAGTDGAEAVAQQLGIIGKGRNLPELSPLDAAGIAFYLLRNVVAGRDVLDYGPPVEIGFWSELGANQRTERRWRREYPPEKVAKLLQYDLDVAEQVRLGRTPAAARRHIERQKAR